VSVPLCTPEIPHDLTWLEPGLLATSRLSYSTANEGSHLSGSQDARALPDADRPAQRSRFVSHATGFVAEE
jgi:hypothetical protein